MARRRLPKPPKSKSPKAILTSNDLASKTTKVGVTSLLALTVLTAGVMAANTAIEIPDIEFGGGVADVQGCTSEAIVNITESISATITDYSIATIPTMCAGKWIRLSIYSNANGTGSPIEQIVWQLPDTGLIPFSLRANGSTVGTAGSTVWPASEAGVLGMKTGGSAINASSARAIRLEVSDSSLADGF